MEWNEWNLFEIFLKLTSEQRRKGAPPEAFWVVTEMTHSLVSQTFFLTYSPSAGVRISRNGNHQTKGGGEGWEQKVNKQLLSEVKRPIIKQKKKFKKHSWISAFFMGWKNGCFFVAQEK